MKLLAFLLLFGFCQLSMSAEDEVVFDDGESDYEELMKEGPLESELSEEEFKKVANVKPRPQLEKKKVPPRVLPEKREPSSLRSGMLIVKSDCSMHEQPNQEAKTLTTLAAGKKVWVDHLNSDWGKVYRKSGEGYVPLSCF